MAAYNKTEALHEDANQHNKFKVQSQIGYLNLERYVQEHKEKMAHRKDNVVQSSIT